LEKLLVMYAPHSLIVHQPWADAADTLEQFLFSLYRHWAQKRASFPPLTKTMNWETEMAKVFG